ncbi:hypothetical protein HK101_005753 [Irineochytrium annulatum]|nr:hypothetical protein HK101_005753 [Irineochytrium annulatum]
MATVDPESAIKRKAAMTRKAAREAGRLAALAEYHRLVALMLKDEEQEGSVSNALWKRLAEVKGWVKWWEKAGNAEPDFDGGQQALKRSDSKRKREDSTTATGWAMKEMQYQLQIRELQEAVATLTRERDELQEKLHPTKFEPVVAGTPAAQCVVDAYAPLPPLTIPAATMPTKPLGWVKMPEHLLPDSIWMSVVDGAYGPSPSASEIILDRPELDALPRFFGKRSAGGVKLLRTTPLSKSLLGTSRARTVEILLSSMWVPHSVIRDALITIDDDVLTTDRLEILRQCVPTVEEANVVHAFRGNPTSLGKADQFILALSTIPRLPQRINALLHRRRVLNDMSGLAQKLGIVSAAVNAIRRSPALVRLLQTVLAVGNCLNKGTFKGKAYGFKVEGLGKLKEIRAADGCEGRARAPTLLHYVARRLEETDEDWRGLKEELGPLEAACKAMALGAGFSAVRAELEELEKQVDFPECVGDGFKETMTSFVAGAVVTVQDATRKADAIGEDLKTLLVYLGEAVEERSAQVEKVFKTLWVFTEELEIAHRENHRAEVAMARKGQSAAILSRRPVPTPFQVAVQQQKFLLRAVGLPESSDSDTAGVIRDSAVDISEEKDLANC